MALARLRPYFALLDKQPTEAYTSPIMAYPLHYLPSGHVFIKQKNNCDQVVDALLKTEYDEEFCVTVFFNEDFLARLMEAGFLVMSGALNDEREEPLYILLPKLHLVRSVLFFPELRVKKSIRPFLSRYELRVDMDFDLVLDKCVQTHGDAWLTPPFVEMLKSIRKRKGMRVKPVSFAVYRNGELKAGEIGVVTGRVYTSYSGYHEENNAGTVQMLLMAQWLDKTGFDFLDFGMPLDYKTQLGAQDIPMRRFVELFRAARYKKINLDFASV